MKFIIKLASDLRLPEAEIYAAKLAELEKTINKNKNRYGFRNKRKTNKQTVTA